MQKIAIFTLCLVAGCAPHNPTVPTQTNADRHWPAPHNPPVMMFTNAPMPPSPMRAVSQSMKAFVAVPRTNSPLVQHWVNFMATNCPGQTLTNPANLGDDQRQACGCNSNAYYAGMARGPIKFRILGLDPNSFSKGYLNIPSLVRESFDGGLSWHFYTLSMDGTFTVEPTNPAAIYQVEWSLNNVNLLK